MCERKEEPEQKQRELRMKAEVRSHGNQWKLPNSKNIVISLPQWGFAVQSLYLVAFLSS